MNNFLDFINRDIEGKKELLTTLPTRTKANKKKFNETLDTYKEKYEEYKKNIYKYLTVKANSLSKRREEDETINSAKEKVVNLERVKFLLNPSNTYLEKMGFDTLLYQINNYYTLDFKSLDNIINGFLDKFEQADIHLSSDDFNYTSYVHEYMTSFLEVRNKKSDSYAKVSEIFEQIYWLNPEIIQHIELNLRRLIRTNAKKFESYILSLQKREMDNNNIQNYAECLERLQSAYIELNLKQKETVSDVIELAKSGAIDIEHYMESSKIRKQAYQSLIADSVNLDDAKKMKNTCDALEKLKLNIDELNNYLEFLPIFDDFKSRFSKVVADAVPTKKTASKGLKDIETQIKNKEDELDKINKKIYSGKPGIFEFKSDHDLKNLKMQSVLIAKELYELYKVYDEEYFKDKLTPILLKTSSISDLLNLYYSFDYFKKLAIQKVYRLNDYDEIIKYSENFDLFAMNPTNVIITGVPIFVETNVPRIICNKYHLNNIHLDEESLDKDNLKSLLNKVLIILRTNKIENSDISLNQIWFIAKVHKYELENEKQNEQEKN